MQTMRKEPLKKRSIGITLVFGSTEEKETYWQLLTAEGRRPAAYILYLLEKELHKAAHKGRPFPIRMELFRSGSGMKAEQSRIKG